MTYRRKSPDAWSLFGIWEQRPAVVTKGSLLVTWPFAAEDAIIADQHLNYRVVGSGIKGSGTLNRLPDLRP